MSGRFSVVATPIGNVSDMSERARSTLQAADLILCEDTRHSAPLLQLIGAHGKTLSCHQHNEEQRTDVVVERLHAGDNVALISDAGAPAVSDPGGRLVEALVARDVVVEVIPGPTAVGAAIMGAGLNTTRFAFLGFLPKRQKARRQLVKSALDAEFAAVIYEAPSRVQDTLDELADIAGGERRVVVARELTKKFETFHRGVLGQQLHPTYVDKGEVVIVVEGGAATVDDDTPQVTAEEWAAQLVADDRLSPKARTKQLMEHAQVSRKEAYALLLAAKEVADAGASSTTTTAADAIVAPLKQAVQAFVKAEGLDAAASQNDVEQALCVYLAERGNGRHGALPAPTETRELAKALLAVVSAADALDDALAMMQDAEARRRPTEDDD